MSSVMENSVWAGTTEWDFMSKDGRADHPSRQILLDRLAAWSAAAPVDMLDCGVLSGVTYEQTSLAGLAVNYTGIDVSASIVDDCRRRFPAGRWHRMSVMDLAFANRSFDTVHCRHVLEHLPYYETAVRELFRVASRHVVLCFFIPPAATERLRRRHDPSGYLWLNQYAREPFERLLRDLARTVEVIDVPDSRRPNRVYVCEPQ